MTAPVLCSVLLALAAVSPAKGDDKEELAKMRAEYASKTDPVDKAKVLAKLGSREIAAVRALINEGDDERAMASLEQYRDAVRDTTRALSESGIDAARRSSGFKELQISLRTSITRLDDLILSLQQNLRPVFRSVRGDLEAAQNILIDALFPAPEPRRSRSASSQ
jgi:hypothetical protein